MAGNLFEAIRDMLMGKDQAAQTYPLNDYQPPAGIDMVGTPADIAPAQQVSPQMPRPVMGGNYAPMQQQVPTQMSAGMSSQAPATPSVTAASGQENVPSLFDKFNAMMGDPEKNAQIVMALNSLRGTPDAGLAAAMQKRIDTAQAMSLTKKRAEAAVAQLKGVGTPDALSAAKLIEANPGMLKEILQKYYAESIKPKTNTTQMSGKDLNAMAVAAGQSAVYDPAKMYNVESGDNGKKVSVIGGGDTIIDMAGNKAAEVISGKAGERDFEQLSAARKAVGDIQKLQQTLSLIRSGNVNTGFGSKIKTNFDRMLAALGGKNAARSVTDTQLLESLLGQDVFGAISSLGIGARGLDTPAEREFLIQVMTGDKSLDKATLEAMTEMRLRYAKRTVDAYNANVDAGYYDYLKDTPLHKRFQKIEIPEYKPELAQPKIGEVRTGRDGSYVFLGGDPSNKSSWQKQ